MTNQPITLARLASWVAPTMVAALLALMSWNLRETVAIRGDLDRIAAVQDERLTDLTEDVTDHEQRIRQLEQGP